MVFQNASCYLHELHFLICSLMALLPDLELQRPQNEALLFYIRTVFKLFGVFVFLFNESFNAVNICI